MSLGLTRECDLPPAVYFACPHPRAARLRAIFALRSMMTGYTPKLPGRVLLLLFALASCRAYQSSSLVLRNGLAVTGYGNYNLTRDCQISTQYIDTWNNENGESPLLPRPPPTPLPPPPLLPPLLLARPPPPSSLPPPPLASSPTPGSAPHPHHLCPPCYLPLPPAGRSWPPPASPDPHSPLFKSGLHPAPSPQVCSPHKARHPME